MAQILAPPPVASSATSVGTGSASVASTVAGTGFYSPPTTGMSSCRTDLSATTAYPGLVVNGVSYVDPTEVDPLVCAKCGGEMGVIAFITEHEVVDAILRHVAKAETRSPRGPPGAAAVSAAS